MRSILHEITVLCGLVTILVLRGTIVLNLSLHSQPNDVEDIDYILREIRSNTGLNLDDEGGEFNANVGFNGPVLSVTEVVATRMMLEWPRGEVELKHVDFAYPTWPDIQVLRDLSLHARGGKALAQVG